MSETTVNRRYKDRLFKKIFSEKDALLSLYNAVNASSYEDPEAIEVNTIEDFIFMGMKNDVSFLFTDVLNLYEQQSTINPNMPLRGFLYFGKLYQKLFGGKTDIYSSVQLQLPTPQFIVFYNGAENAPDQWELRMSDSFAGTTKYPPSIECTVLLLNINAGHNEELMAKCESLKGYAALIQKIRNYLSQGMEKELAILTAVDECIRGDILREILEKHREEAINMLLTEYDEELHIQNEKNISYETGFRAGEAQGITKGISQGISQGQIALKEAIQALHAGATREELLKQFDEATVNAAFECIKI
ncbi:MAG: hypothetical protein IKS07_08275 [Lachnospiraceae bacterium]|nr:hypothetical protein [Lachnospiraceae bacterium]